MGVNNQLVERRRKEILAAAEKVFDENGYASTTMEAVAGQAGISKGSIYNYFQNKADLFSQVFLSLIGEDALAEQDFADENFTATEKLDRLLNNWFARLEHYKRLGRLVLECQATAARESQEGELAEVLTNIHADWRRKLMEVLAWGIRNGEFKLDFGPEVAASLIISVIDGIMVQAIFDVGIVVDAEFLSALKVAIMAGLHSGTGTRPVAEGQVLA